MRHGAPANRYPRVLPKLLIVLLCTLLLVPGLNANFMQGPVCAADGSPAVAPDLLRVEAVREFWQDGSPTDAWYFIAKRLQFEVDLEFGQRRLLIAPPRGHRTAGEQRQRAVMRRCLQGRGGQYPVSP